jgi:hypothetical protein
MARRKAPSPDVRPKWDDPNLPCIRNYKMGDGSIKTEVDEDYERRFREYMMSAAPHPRHIEDPTYNLRRKK